MTTSLKKIAAIVQHLAAKSEAEELEWSEVMPEIFEAKLGVTAVRVSQHVSDYDPEADPDYYVSFLRGNQWVDSVSDTDLQKYLPNPFLTMRSLYASARRIARGLSEILDDIAAELEKKTSS